MIRINYAKSFIRIKTSILCKVKTLAVLKVINKFLDNTNLKKLNILQLIFYEDFIKGIEYYF